MVNGRQELLQWSRIQSSTGQGCRGWPLPKEEYGTINRNSEEETHAHWYAFHRTFASFAVPDDE
jgi:hypothetical protein